MAIINYFGKTLAASTWSRVTYTATSLVNSTVTGTNQHEGFSVGVGNYTLAGGGGDDQYYGVNNSYRIVELDDGGIDTVWLSYSYVAAPNIENIIVGWAPGVVGNAQDNYIKGDGRFSQIEGGAGNDVLTGGGGGDRFEFNRGSGYDVITDFRTGASSSTAVSPDTVRLAGYTGFQDFDDVRAALTQSGSDVVLTLAPDAAIKFTGTRVADFTADNFLLAFDPSGLTKTFEDNFDSLSLWDGLASGTWRTDYGWGNDRNAPMARTLSTNGEKQIYVDTEMTGRNGVDININPFSVNNGILTIEADTTPVGMQDALYGYKYTSGLLTTRNSFTQTYGYFEARMELPAEKGAWPAFWLYTTGTNGSELDVMESRGTDYTTVNAHDYSTGTHQAPGSWIYQPDLATGFHTYGVLWTAEKVTWYLDGVAVRSIDTPGDMHGPMYLLINLALDSSVPNDFDGAEVKIDYVRAYSLDNLPAGLAAGGTTAPAKFWEYTGTAGNDRFTIITPQDRIHEAANGGIDHVTAESDYVLPANVENMTLKDLAKIGTGNALANRIEGNALDNVLTGYDGNDTLFGGYGADRMIGGMGNDTYEVDNVRDVVVELADQGTDVVYSSINYTLGAHLEQLILTGSAINGTGNDLANSITGNAMANRLTGGGGNDWIDGGAGADTMIGGAGNDSYVVDNKSDVVIEQAGSDQDIIYSSVDYNLPANVERLVLQGNALRGGTLANGGQVTGNALGNTLTGMNAADYLDGGAGDDILYGNGGNDRLVGGLGNDFLRGGDGNDQLDGGLGADTYQGGAGRDTFSIIDITHTGNTFATADKIQDLVRSEGDRIDLTGIDANSLAAGNQAFSWIGTGAFTGVAGQLRDQVSGTNHMVLGDVNGDRVADFMVVVSLHGNPPLLATDFVL
ncbi:family 16 glycosylhydrolase [Sphingomonas sp. 1P06PA]|uniref:family 16 glycosylhydrolase n=1 Tax=Sphingomonas sp. 1P06PA TaxID=554121 RepID=UPI0039A63FC8